MDETGGLGTFGAERDADDGTDDVATYEVVTDPASLAARSMQRGGRQSSIDREHDRAGAGVVGLHRMSVRRSRSSHAATRNA